MSLVRARLVAGGAEERLSRTQFGFRRGYVTLDAIFFLRRKIESALTLENGQALVLALDWQKTFDSINPEAMLVALGCFGLPDHVLKVIKSSYT